MSWGDDLTRYIAAAEARVRDYSERLAVAGRARDAETVAHLRPLKIDEARWLAALRAEKTAWNARMWLRPGGEA